MKIVKPEQYDAHIDLLRLTHDLKVVTIEQLNAAMWAFTAEHGPTWETCDECGNVGWDYCECSYGDDDHDHDEECGCFDPGCLECSDHSP